jgi:hypothetical protein
LDIQPLNEQIVRPFRARRRQWAVLKLLLTQYELCYPRDQKTLLGHEAA